MATAIIRPVRAYETEIVQIRWTLADGTTYEQRVRVPPAETRKARQAEQQPLGHPDRGGSR